MTRQVKNKDNEKKSVTDLNNYCDLNSLHSILENWALGTGLSAIVIDSDGQPASKSYGMSPICQMIQDTEEGNSRCEKTWKENNEGIHICHAGFYDFSIPLVLPDGTEIGKVLAGQVLSEEQDENEVLQRISDLDIDKEKAKEILKSARKIKENQIKSSYNLLKQSVDFFLEKSFATYRAIEGRKSDVATLTAALKTVYRISMFFNLTKNEYHLMYVQTGVSQVLPEKGKIDDIVKIGVLSIPDEVQAKEYFDMFNRKALILAYKAGQKELTLQHQQKIYNGETHWMEARLVFVESNNDEIHAVCLSRIIDDDIQNKLILRDALEKSKQQQTLLQEALDNYKQADYDRRRDFLTGLRNRQDMFDLFHDTLSGKRSQIKSMFMMDIDNFKNLNDLYGHVYGDECLKRIGAALHQYGIENNMYFYRYGGEEMLGISFDNSKPDAQIADELVKLVYNLQIKRSDSKFGVVTISLGYTSDNSRYEKMIDKADSAMYLSKRDGKNKASCYEETE